MSETKSGDTPTTESSDQKELATVLFLLYRHYIKGIALKYAPMVHIADEVVQQVYIKFVTNADRFDLGNNPKVLLAVLTRNVARDYWRSESRHFSDNMKNIAEHIRDIADEDDAEIYADELEALQHCLSKAPEKTRELIRLYYFGRVPVKEIAEKTGSTGDAIYKAFFRLREKLKSCIERVINEGSSYV